jgi:hypothetical protein
MARSANWRARIKPSFLRTVPAKKPRAGYFDRRQRVSEHRQENVHHLPIAIIGASELAPHALDRRRQTQSLKGAPLRKAPGLPARTGT